MWAPLSWMRSRLRSDSDFANEIESHVAMETERLVSEGWADAEAANEARRRFGNLGVAQESFHERRTIRAVEATVQDLRYGLRTLRSSPRFSVTVVLSLSIGIGAMTTVFTLINALLLRPLPVLDPDQLVSITRSGNSVGDNGFMFSEYQRLRERAPLLSAVAAYAPVRLSAGVDDKLDAAAEAAMVSGGFFGLLGISAPAGRLIGPDDDRAVGTHAVAVISDAYWRRRFARAPAAIGATIRLAGRAFTIIGVTAPGFTGIEVGSAPDIFVPLTMQPIVMPAAENWIENPIRRHFWLRVVGRLHPGVTVERASAAMTAANPLDDASAKSGGRPTVPVLHSAATGISDVGRRFADSLVLLAGLVGLVFLAAAANVANLCLARGTSRSRELAVRLAIGSSRWRLARQLLTEGVLIAAAAGIAGTAVAYWSTKFFLAFISVGGPAVVLNVAPDWRVLSFVAAAALTATVVFSAVPAIRLTEVNPAESLRGRGVRRGRVSPLRSGSAFVVAQVALGFVLVFGAALLLRSLYALTARADATLLASVFTVRIEPAGSDQRNVPGTSERLDALYQTVLDRVRAIPGVASASFAQLTPTEGAGRTVQPLQLPSGEDLRASIQMIYPELFETLGVRFLAGRDLTRPDVAAGAPPVAVVNKAFARMAFDGTDAVGRRYVMPFKGVGREYQIVGVTEDSPYASVRGDPAPVIFQPFLQTSTGRGQMVLHVRVSGASGQVVWLLREAVRQVIPRLPTFDVIRLSDEVDRMLVRERLLTLMASCLAGVAVVLTCMGLYGLTAFSALQQRREIGIRIALGASQTAVVGSVMARALIPLAIGLLIGIPVALAGSRMAGARISTVLFGIDAADPATLTLAGAIVFTIACVAAYLPSRRASRVDPMLALRLE